MRFVAGNKTPREAGMKNLKKMAKQQAAYGESRTAPASNKTRHVKNTKQKLSVRLPQTGGVEGAGTTIVADSSVVWRVSERLGRI